MSKSIYKQKTYTVNEIQDLVSNVVDTIAASVQDSIDNDDPPETLLDKVKQHKFVNFGLI